MKNKKKKALIFILIGIAAAFLICAAVFSQSTVPVFGYDDEPPAEADDFTNDSQKAYADSDGVEMLRSFSSANGFEEHLESVEMPSVQSGKSRFVEYVPKEFLEYDTKKEYIGMQGSCTDGRYYFTAFLVKQKKTGTVLDAKLICTYEASGVDDKVLFYKISLYGGLLDYIKHANGMTYNSVTDEVIIACCSQGFEQYVYIVPASDLRKSVGEPRFRRQTISCKVNSVAYNATRNKYVAALCGTSTQFALLDSSFQVEKTFGTKTPGVDDTWSVQGICCDNKYIYSLLYLSTDEYKAYNKKNPENEVDYYSLNKLRIYDWNGNCVKTVHFSFKRSLLGWLYETESIVVKDDRIMLFTACMNTVKNRSFNYIDLSEYAFHIQFCPDENVDAYAGHYNNGNVGGLFIRGVATSLYKNRISKPGKSFAGWTAYRVEDKTWRYCSASNRNEAGWYAEGAQPAGYVKYTYTNGQSVSKTGAGGSHILMCAQWDDTDSFYVSYKPNGGTGTMSESRHACGETAYLSANTFEKPDRTFLGWNAYCEELNKWHYISSDGVKDGWYVEGLQPEGYIKWLYYDKQDISDIVDAGTHVTMYAVWDEFYIEYNANGKAVKPNGIKERQNAKHQSGKTNPVTGFNPAYVNGKFSVSGYYYYRKDVNKWRYTDAATGKSGWYAEGAQPEGYEKYFLKLTYDPELFAYPDGVRFLGATVPAGETLVLYAEWKNE